MPQYDDNNPYSNGGYNGQQYQQQGQQYQPYQQQGQQQYQPYPQQGQQAYHSYQQPNKKSIGIAALVLGIVTFLVALLPFFGLFLATLPGIVAVILGIIGIVKMNGRKMSIIGLVLAIIAIPASIASTMIFGAAVIEENGGNVSEMLEVIENKGENLTAEDLENALGNTLANELKNEEATRNATSASNENTGSNTNETTSNTASESQNQELSYHGNFTPSQYRNDYFNVTVTDGSGQYVLSQDSGLNEVKVRYNASSTASLTVTADGIAAADLESYINTRTQLMGGERTDVYVAGQTVPGILEHVLYPDGFEEWNITVAKIVDGCQLDITAVGKTQEEARVAFDAVSVF